MWTSEITKCTETSRPTPVSSPETLPRKAISYTGVHVHTQKMAGAMIHSVEVSCGCSFFPLGRDVFRGSNIYFHSSLSSKAGSASQASWQGSTRSYAEALNKMCKQEALHWSYQDHLWVHCQSLRGQCLLQHVYLSSTQALTSTQAMRV